MAYFCENKAKIEMFKLSFDHQKFVFGEAAVTFMSEANILVYGMTGVGAEIAKNLIMSGFKHITIQDGKTVSNVDVKTNFFLENGRQSIQENRSKASYAKLKSLNPDADIKVVPMDINQDFDLNYLSLYQCVIVCDQGLSTQITINNFCVSQKPPIKFISANIFGMLCSVFCDFEDEDKTQELAPDFPPAASRLNDSGNTCLLPSLCESTRRVSSHFDTIEKQLWNPSLLNDESGKQSQLVLHLALMCLYKFNEEFSRLPNLWCHKDSKLFIDLGEKLKDQLFVSDFDHNFFESLSFTSRGCFLPLVTMLGGIVVHEVIKTVLEIDRPLRQWFHFTGSEVASDASRKLIDESKQNCFTHAINPNTDKPLSTPDVCIDDELLLRLQNIHLFMVGCGSVGCEILKMLSLFGAATSEGEITVCDDGIIEKTHLTRQLLFSHQYINQFKCTVARKEIEKHNPALNIVSSSSNLCMKNEHIYNDNFFKKQDIIIANLDNTSSRRYLDNCCILYGKPWIDAGTQGTRGHVQVIIPHLTEHYFSCSDSEDDQYPYCAIKSFPVQIEHTVQWAIEKFNNLFTIKPSSYKFVWERHGGIAGVIQKLEAREKIENLLIALELLKLKLKSWTDCVLLARNKFEKYFNHKAQQLLHLFPADLTTESGPFWQFPKLVPRKVQFDQNNSLHMLFVISSAKLFANVWKISYTSKDVQEDSILKILQNVQITSFQPISNKKVVTSENEERPSENVSLDEHTLPEIIDVLKKAMQEYPTGYPQVTPEKFNKYDDSKGQVDFIYSSSNIRALMYGINPASYVKTQFITGRIVPSLPSTNAVIAGLAALELLKMLKGFKKKCFYSNYFINLAMPSFIYSEPASSQLCTLREDFSYSIWDHLDIIGNKSQTLSQFIEILQDQYKLDPTMITQGSKIIWTLLLPGYTKRKSKRMTSLLHFSQAQRFVELSVTTQLSTGEEEMAPSIHYYIT